MYWWKRQHSGLIAQRGRSSWAGKTGLLIKGISDGAGREREEHKEMGEGDLEHLVKGLEKR